MVNGQSPQTIIKPLLIFTLLADIVCFGLFIMILAKGYSGIDTTYQSIIVCNTYLVTKYETQKHIAYRARFIALIIALIALTIQSISNIRSFIKIKDLQQAKNSQIFKWTQYDLCAKYICQSMAILLILPLFVFYLSITVEQGKCLSSISIDWIIFAIGGAIALISSLICWIIILRYAVGQPIEGKEQRQQKNIHHNELRQREQQMKNIFQMEGQEMYKTNRSSSNRQVFEPLMVPNSPIPLFHPTKTPKNYAAITPKNNAAVAPQNYAAVTPKKQSRYQQQFNNNSNMNPPVQSTRKKSNAQPQVSRSVKNNSQLSKMIEKKKEKFRQINPFKVQNKSGSPSKVEVNNEKEQQQYYDLVEEKNKMKNLPKQYYDYIKQSKRPKRMPDIPKLEDLIHKQFIKSLIKEEPKPFLKKYKKSKQKNTELKQGEIQFIDEDEVEEVTEPNKNEPQLFYHKPIIEKKIIKKRKALFEEDIVIQPNKFLLDQNEWKDVIINKLKQGKSNQKSKLNLNQQTFEDGSNQPKKKIPKILSKQDLMVNFLKSKYNTQKDQIL